VSWALSTDTALSASHSQEIMCGGLAPTRSKKQITRFTNRRHKPKHYTQAIDDLLLSA
jgi:hypothetical protein